MPRQKRTPRPVKKPRRSATRYTPEQKAEALLLYQQHGPREAARLSKVAPRTISRWAKAGGLKTEVVAVTQAATEAAAAKAEELRAQLRARLMQIANDVADRIYHEHIDFRGKDAERVVFPLPSPTGVREYMVAIGIALDKYRLEMGETTDRRALVHSGSLSLEGVPDEQLRAELARLVAKLS